MTVFCPRPACVRISYITLAINRTRQACLRFASALLPRPGIYIDVDSTVIFNLPATSV